MIYPVVRELAADGVPVATACRMLNVSTSSFYDRRDRPTSPPAPRRGHPPGPGSRTQRRSGGWSIADHLRSDIVVDALEMTCWRRKPTAQSLERGGTVVHSDHGSQYTSWAFGQRLRTAGLLGSTGSVGDRFDNALAESFFSSLRIELLDRRSWVTRQQLANAIFERIEAWYNPRRRHSAPGYRSPIDYETLQPAATAAA